MKQFNIGLFGFGNVGRGLYDVLVQTNQQHATIKRVCVRNINKDRGVDKALFTDNADDIFNDPDINMIVELIDDATASLSIVTRALKAHKPVVTGNKHMLAHHLEDLVALQRETGTPLLYDASACGSIPVIRNLEEYYDNDLLVSVKGILNGTSNFILSKIFNENMSYPDALKLAQDLGFAEANPTSDIEGLDSLYKLVIITVHAFGRYVKPQDIFVYGISTMNEADIRFAHEKERRIKLIGHVEKLEDNRLVMCVMPQLLSRDKYIYSVEDEFNGVVIKGKYYGKQFMFGRGAGGYPTGSAVLSDIMACSYDYSYEYKKLSAPQVPEYSTDVPFRIYVRYNTSADLALFNFLSISENYTSDTTNYVVGTIKLSELVRIKPQLHGRNLFIAAYPRD
ncbi:MAG: homoserine dehydrogenase [Muribaculaceae bacterium]|nr:homoserine dehydrogenase [Muribaculaceae bacterium]